MGNTVWFKVTGTGGSITVNTFGSFFDTMIVAYKTDGMGSPSSTSGPPAFANVAGCSDDVSTVGKGVAQSRLSFQTD
jgi:hypothetical protein